MPTGLPASTTINAVIFCIELMISSASLTSWSGRTVFGPVRHHLLDVAVEQVGAHVPAQIAVGDDADEMAAMVGDADAAEGLGGHLGHRLRHRRADRGERDRRRRYA